jgi:hypothetical protein
MVFLSLVSEFSTSMPGLALVLNSLIGAAVDWRECLVCCVEVCRDCVDIAFIESTH